MLRQIGFVALGLQPGWTEGVRSFHLMTLPQSCYILS
jgi:hypothetical protein